MPGSSFPGYISQDSPEKENQLEIETHIYTWGGQSALLSLLIPMLISPRNTLTDTPRIMFDQISGLPVAWSSWYILVTMMLVNYVNKGKSQTRSTKRSDLLHCLPESKRPGLLFWKVSGEANQLPLVTSRDEEDGPPGTEEGLITQGPDPKHHPDVCNMSTWRDSITSSDAQTVCHGNKPRNHCSRVFLRS